VPDWLPVGQVRRRKAVVLDGSGNGSVNFDVPSANHKWIIEDVHGGTDQAQTTAPYPTVTAYLGGQQIGVSSGATYIGAQFTLRGTAEMEPGLDLTVAFTGGVAGSKGTVIIEGKGYLWR
jgi:hypothetical protein